MSSLAPIPAGSRMAADIARMEDVLRRLRDCLPADARDAIGVADAGRGGSVTWFSKLSLSGESPDWASFYRYYAIDWRDARATDAERAMLKAADGPRWVRVYSENRLGWVRHLPSLLGALAGMNVSVNVETSWRWDHRNTRKGGQATYVPAYQLMVCLSDQPFAPGPVLDKALAGLCAVDHPLADRHLFDWQQDTVGRLLFYSYRWTSEGIAAAFESRKDLELAVETLFAGFETSVEPLPGKRWLLTVRLVSAPPTQTLSS